ncbi:MAG: hypothetical protein JRJ70_05460 [Deltaproteobacteria bacterium]|nr:hypothetical protein [Deltaproteobacteria bacterium]
MLDEKNDLGSPNGWLKRAKSNLIRAKQPKHEEEIKNLLTAGTLPNRT